ncbi:DUF4242 domain-containing protein [Rhodococcus hoagii]|nr:DUF4242 domain-containing protein [Prescottella equi]
MSSKAVYLYEIAPSAARRDQIEQIIKEFDSSTAAAGGELIETQVTKGGERIFAITEFDGCAAPLLDADALDAAELDGPHLVRIVGADIEEIKAARPDAGYLVEWDIPAEIDMETYLTRKKEKSPLYANIRRSASCGRTSARTPPSACGFYNAPDEDAVRRAREVVSTPVSRLHQLDTER